MKKKTKGKVKSAISKVTAFIKAMDKDGIKVSVQFIEDNHVAFISSMNLPEALGSCDVAKIILRNGLNTGQTLDSLVQTMEKRPELVERMSKALNH